MEYKCSVCLGTLFAVNTDVSVTQCGHMYHNTCLENLVQNNTKFPNCRTEIRNAVYKVYPDVYDELVYNGISNETKHFLEEIYSHEKEKRITLLNIIKRLDKENTNLKEINKTNQDNLKTCKLFIKGFEKDKRDWQERNQALQTENSTLIAELEKLNINTEFKIIPEELFYSCNDSCTNVEAILCKGLFNLCYFIFLMFLNNFIHLNF